MWWPFLLLEVRAQEPDPAVAGPDPAEYARLAQEIELLASKNAWAGVEKAFQQIRTTGVEPSAQVLVRGAESAQAVGDISATRERLLAASKVTSEPELQREVVDWLYDLERQYWGFRLVCDRESGLPPFEPLVQPFDPIAVRAIRFAQERMAESCLFEGFLPVGEYRLGTHAFTVTSGTPKPTSLNLRDEVLSKSDRLAAREKWAALGIEP